MRLGIKLALVVIGLWATLLVVGVAVAHSSNTPQPRLAKLVHAEFVQVADQVGGKARAGRTSCIGPVEKHTFVCTQFITTVNGAKVCVKDYFAWIGKQVLPWQQPWSCKAKRPKLPPVPGTSISPSGPDA